MASFEALRGGRGALCPRARPLSAVVSLYAGTPRCNGVKHETSGARNDLSATV